MFLLGTAEIRYLDTASWRWALTNLTVRGIMDDEEQHTFTRNVSISNFFFVDFMYRTITCLQYAYRDLHCLFAASNLGVQLSLLTPLAWAGW